MRYKLNVPILGLFAALEEVFSTAASKIDSYKFTARGVADRLEQTPTNPAKKARRKIIQASQRRNRL
jgi:hypothetical protein